MSEPVFVELDPNTEPTPPTLVTLMTVQLDSASGELRLPALPRDEVLAILRGLEERHVPLSCNVDDKDNRSGVALLLSIGSQMQQQLIFRAVLSTLADGLAVKKEDGVDILDPSLRKN
jgi:hypothetical protein